MAFDFSLPDRVDQWRDRITRFVDEVVIPREQDAFAHGVDDTLRKELQQEAKAAGLWAPQAPAELGGGGFAFDEAAVLLEEAGRSLLGPLALNCSAPDEGNIHLLHMIATRSQQERYLLPLAAGDVRSCFAMTEPPPGAGSDPAALVTSATKVRVVDRSVQLCGGLGTSDELVVGRIYADVRAFRIYDGASEVHRMSIAKRAARRARADG